MKPGNYAWFGSNGIYIVEVDGAYVPIFPKDFGCHPWEPRLAMVRFLAAVKYLLKDEVE